MPEAIAEDFGIPIAALFALAYAHRHPEGIEAIRAADAKAVTKLKRGIGSSG